MKKLNVMFIGAPGSGKGTQSALVCERFGLVHISTGDILRAERKAKTELGNMAQSYIDEGKLVPDDVIMGIVRNRLEKDDCKESGCLFDGFPRTVAQADALAEFLKLDVVVAFNVANEALLRRISGRRVCKDCGATYHVDQIGDKLSCEKCGGEVYQRSDDQEATVKNRISVYEEQTAPLIQYYSKHSILHHIDADKPVQEVFAQVTEVLEKAQS